MSFHGKRSGLRPIQFDNLVCQFIERHIDRRMLIIWHTLHAAVDERLPHRKLATVYRYLAESEPLSA